MNRYVITVESTGGLQPPVNQLRQFRNLAEAVGLRLVEAREVAAEKPMAGSAAGDDQRTSNS